MNIAPRALAASLALALAPLAAWAQDGQVTGTAHLQVDGQPVQVNSVEPDSVVGQYRIDFDKLDRNHDGYIDRKEAKADPTLSAEFDAVDVHHWGRLSKADLKGWMG